MRFKFIKFTLVLGTILFSSQGFSQVKISELLQKSDYHAENSKQKLFMIEFWASLVIVVTVTSRYCAGRST